MFKLTISKKALEVLTPWISDNLKPFMIEQPKNVYIDEYVFIMPSKEKLDAHVYAVANDLGRLAWINYFVDQDVHIKIDRIGYQEVRVYNDFILDLDVYDPESNKSVFDIFKATNTYYEVVIENDDEYIIKVPRQNVTLLATEKDEFMNVLSFYTAGTTYITQYGYNDYMINFEV